MSKPAPQDIVLLTERLLSHQLAHNLNNSLGAIGVFAEMIIDDYRDPKLQARLQKMCFAAEMARGQVNALRYAVPRYNEQTDSADLMVVYDYVAIMLSDTVARLMPDETLKVSLMLKGPQSLLVHALYTLLSHVLGASGEAVLVTADADDDIHMAEIRIVTAAKVNPLATDAGLLVDILVYAGARLDVIENQGEQNGFALHWPLAPSMIDE